MRFQRITCRTILGSFHCYDKQYNVWLAWLAYNFVFCTLLKRSIYLLIILWKYMCMALCFMKVLIFLLCFSLIIFCYLSWIAFFSTKKNKTKTFSFSNTCQFFHVILYYFLIEFFVEVFLVLLILNLKTVFSVSSCFVVIVLLFSN